MSRRDEGFTLWTNRTRSDTSRLGAGERPFDYFDRAAGARADAVRTLLDDWVAEFPSQHRRGLIGRLGADEYQFEGAFWELYLHELLRRDGYEIDVHPRVPGTSSRPDFLLRDGGTRFYLEARVIERRPGDMAEKARLEYFYDSLRDLKTREPFKVFVHHVTVGTQSPSARRLHSWIDEWLGQLDHDRAIRRHHERGIAEAPRQQWHHGGWTFEVVAIPRETPSQGTHQTVSGWGASSATRVKNHLPVLEGLKDKASKLAGFNLPLIIALLCNTAFHTEPHQIERALYGLHLPHPPDGVPTPRTLQADGEGFWIDESGFKRHDVPQVITASNLGVVGTTSITATPVLWPHPTRSTLGPLRSPGFAQATLGPLEVHPPAVRPAEIMELEDNFTS